MNSTFDGVTEWCSRRFFSLVHRNSLVYNACWEDPQQDRIALDLGPRDTVLMITSAGCNALDYALAGPRQIYAVDVNPRQNALLELKIAAIRALDFETFFALFGKGRLEGFASLYRQRLRPLLSPGAAAHWDCQQDFFSGTSARSGFYFRGSSGFIARWMNRYIDHARLREYLHASFAADSLAEQEYIYRSVLRKAFWTGLLQTALRWDLTFAFLGVPRAQRRELENSVEGGMCGFLENTFDTIFTRLPLKENYFWWLYINGAYSPERCPEYLKEPNFQALKAGLVDRIQIHTDSLVGFMKGQKGKISRFVLLDHMDWLRGSLQPVLEREWQLFLTLATPDAKILWRSASPRGNFVDELTVSSRGQRYSLKDALVYHTELADSLHKKDRVQTYASFSIATLAPGWAASCG